MKVNNSSEIVYFDNEPISRAEQLMFNVPRTMRYSTNNIVKINGKCYYVKRCTTRSLINELIGSYYSALIGASAVDYVIGKSNTELSYLYALSEVFWQDEYAYTTVDDAIGMKPDDTRVYSRGFDRYYVNDTSVLDFVKSPVLVDSALKMTAVDIKTGQTDRFNYNVVLRSLNDELEMEKLYDFGATYQDDVGYSLYDCYYNPFLLVKKNTISLWGLAHRYPQISESAAILSEAPLYDVLKGIEKRFNIKIEDRDIPGYIELDKKYSKSLRKLR